MVDHNFPHFPQWKLGQNWGFISHFQTTRRHGFNRAYAFNARRTKRRGPVMSSADKAWVILFIPHCNVTEMMVGIGFNYPQWNPHWPNCSICFRMCTWIWAAIVRTEHSAGISWRLNRYYYMNGMFQQKCSREQVVHPYMNHVWNMCQDLAPKW